MSKLIVEMEMNGIPNCCGLCDPLFAVVCALKHDQTIDKMMLCVGRPSWCPIKGVLPDEHGDLIDRDELKRKKVYSHERHEYVVPVAYIDWEQAVIKAEKGKR